MSLTLEKFSMIAASARETLRETLKMIAIHEAGMQDGRRDSFLNAPTLLMAVVAWERFIEDLAGASVFETWCAPGDWPVWDGPKTWPLSERSGKVVWPGSGKSEEARVKHCAGRHPLDALLIDSGTLDAPLTESWQAWVSTWYVGKRPAGWLFAGSGESGAVGQELRAGTETIFEALLSASSARDAAAHGLYDKKADDAATKGWYWWYSDADTRERGEAGAETSASGSSPGTVIKKRTGRPSIQSGYVRGVTALVVQLIDCSITAIVRYNGWPESLRLPADWFDKAPTEGARIAGVEIWSGETLHRLP